MSLVLALVTGGALHAEEAHGVAGVFGFNNVTDATYLAVWVPVEDGAVVTGVSWYQNDGSTRYPAILAEAGLLDWPGGMSEAVELARDVPGWTSDWSETIFSQPITSESAGLYLYFQLPEGSVFLHEGAGGGFGLGYSVGDGVRRCWMSGNGEDWNPMDSRYAMAVEPIVQNDKAAVDVLVLRIAGSGPATPPSVESVWTPNMTVFPNPFNPHVEIHFTIPQAGEVDLEVYDLRGRQVRTLLGKFLEQGEHSVIWDGCDEKGSRVSSGVYFAKLAAGSMDFCRRLVLIK